MKARLRLSCGSLKELLRHLAIGNDALVLHGAEQFFGIAHLARARTRCDSMTVRLVYEALSYCMRP